MEQSSDKVLENALANGGEPHTHTPRHTHTLRVLITTYRNSLGKCRAGTDDMHIANEGNNYLNQIPYACRSLHFQTHTHSQR